LGGFKEVLDTAGARVRSSGDLPVPVHGEEHLEFHCRKRLGEEIAKSPELLAVGRHRGTTRFCSPPPARKIPQSVRISPVLTQELSLGHNFFETSPLVNLG
jgi:hypothetical protein